MDTANGAVYQLPRVQENACVSPREGVVKYLLDYRPSPLPANLDLQPLRDWFQRCRERGLIGRDPTRYDGLAYGNISVRAGDGFVISATQTGGEPELSPDRLAWVSAFDPGANRLNAGGPAPPSSEAMTHGQIYRALPRVGGVIHVHSPVLWRAADRLSIPATPVDVAYGTPAMADAVDRLLRAVPECPAGLLSMGGHEDGIVAYGSDLDAAGAALLDALARAGAEGHSQATSS